MRFFALLRTSAVLASIAALPVARQLPGVVDYDPTPPAVATYPTFVDVAATLAGPGTTVDDEGTGRGHAWVDVVGPDPTDPTHPGKIGPPDGLLDLVQTNSDSPALPLGATETEWTYPPVAATAHKCIVYRAAADGVLTDVTALMMPGVTDGFDLQYPGASPWGVVAGDYDGDGDQDLFYPCGAFNMRSRNALMRSNGDGTFDNVTVEAGMLEEQASFGAAWFDYDRDGDLDVFQTNSAKMFFAGWQGPDLPDPRARLYRNEGDGTFAEVGEAAGVQLTSSSFATAVSDLDRDGWPDIVVSCFRRYNKVFYNNGDGTFSFMAPKQNADFDIDMEEALVWTPQGTDKDFGAIPAEWDVLPVEGILSIPVELQDFNGDGWTDVLYGCWSVQLEDAETTSALGALFEPSDRAYLYLNRGDEDGDGLGDGTFREAALDVGLGHVGGVMGMIASDFNGDGFADVFMGGGGPDLLAHLEEDYLYINEGTDWPVNFLADPDQPLTQIFYEVGALAGTYSNINMAHGTTARRGVAGRIDLSVANGGPAVFEGGQPNYYFENQGNVDASTPAYLAVDLEPSASPPGAQGARVDVIGTGVAPWGAQERRSGIGFTSHNDGPLLFGLGTGEALAVNVLWPSGVRQGRVLFPHETGAASVALVESTFSLGTDLEYTAAGEVTLTLRVEETGPAPARAQLWFFVITPLGGGAVSSFALPLGAPLPFVPGAPLELGGTLPFLPTGLYGFAAFDPRAGDLIGAGTVWHDADAASAPLLANEGAVEAAPVDTDPVVERYRPRPLVQFGRQVVARATSVATAPARVPLAWETLALEGAGERTFFDGSVLSWRDGEVTLDVSAATEGASLSFQGEQPLVSLDRPLACCTVRADARGRLLRFEGLSGDLAVDGRPYSPAGVPLP